MKTLIFFLLLSGVATAQQSIMAVGPVTESEWNDELKVISNGMEECRVHTMPILTTPSRNVLIEKEIIKNAVHISKDCYKELGARLDQLMQNLEDRGYMLNPEPAPTE